VGVQGAPRKRAAALRAAGAEVIQVPAARGPRGRHQVALEPMLRALAEREVLTVMLEGGPRLSGGLWREGLIQRVVAYVAPKVLGDPAALPMMAAGEVPLMAGATELLDVQVRRLGRDVMIAGRVPGASGEEA